MDSIVGGRCGKCRADDMDAVAESFVGPSLAVSFIASSIFFSFTSRSGSTNFTSLLGLCASAGSSKPPESS